MVGATRSKEPFGMMGLIFAFLGDDVPPSFPVRAKATSAEEECHSFLLPGSKSRRAVRDADRRRGDLPRTLELRHGIPAQHGFVIRLPRRLSRSCSCGLPDVIIFGDRQRPSCLL